MRIKPVAIGIEHTAQMREGLKSGDTFCNRCSPSGKSKRCLSCTCNIVLPASSSRWWSDQGLSRGNAGTGWSYNVKSCPDARVEFRGVNTTMRVSFHEERVLAIVAHPDDAELLCAGTLIRARADAAAAGVCVLCRGDKGAPAGDTIDNLANVRRAEMQAAADVAGLELFPGESGDGELRDDETTRERLVQLVRRFRPTLILAHTPTDYHIDHRTAGELAEIASWLCASNSRPHLGPPIAAPPALWWMDTVGMQGFEPHFYIDISPQADLKEQMLACHTSQLARADDRDFTSLPELMRNQYQTRGRQAGVAAAEAFRCYHAFKRSRAW